MTTPIPRAFIVMAIVALLYEPLRLALSPALGGAVGGVGGVGGLTNLAGGYENCSTTAGSTDAGYCFYQGEFLGFTPFAAAVTLAWTLPLIVSAALVARRTRFGQSGPLPPVLTSTTTGRGDFRTVWVGISLIWFAVPFASYITAPFYQQDAWHMVLAFAIASAFPLSWHLSLVAIPSAGSLFLPTLLGISRDELMQVHMCVAYGTVFWAAAHAIGEAIYLISQSDGANYFNVRNGESLLFLFGVVNVLLLCILVPIAYLRRTMARSSFRSVHRLLAALLLLGGAAHWWPFAIFLCPAIAVAAVGHAAKSCTFTPDDVHAVSRALVVAGMGTLVGLSVVWCWREKVMGRAGADTYSAFFFPPTAVIAAFACARGGLEAFHQRDDWHQAPPSTDDERSLLIEDCDES